MLKLKNTIGMLTIAFAVVALMSSCSITTPVNATGNAVGSKVGSSTATIYLGMLVFNGDASIKSAAKNGGISKISTVDVKQTNILGIIGTVECIVTGE